MRHAAAEHVPVGLARQVDIVRVAAFATQELCILFAKRRVADSVRRQGGSGILNVHGASDLDMHLNVMAGAYSGHLARWSTPS